MTSTLISLANGILAFDGFALVSGAPASVSALQDPLGNGVFLRLECEKPSDRQIHDIGGLPGMKRFVCCYRYDAWWNTPRFGTNASEIPSDTQFMLAELGNGSYAAFFPMLDGPFHCAIEGDGNDRLQLVAESGDRRQVRDRTLHRRRRQPVLARPRVRGKHLQVDGPRPPKR